MAMAAGVPPLGGSNRVGGVAPGAAVAPPPDPFSKENLRFLADAIRIQGRSEAQSIEAADALARCVYGSTLDLTDPPLIRLTEPVMHALAAWAETHNGTKLSNARIDLSATNASRLIKSLSFIKDSITGIDFCHLAESNAEHHLDLRPFRDLTLTGLIACNGSVKAQPNVRFHCRVSDAVAFEIGTSKWIERYRGGAFSREDTPSASPKLAWAGKLSALCSPSPDRGPVPDSKRPAEASEREEAPPPVVAFKAGQTLNYHGQTLEVLRVHDRAGFVEVESDRRLPAPLGMKPLSDGHNRYSYLVRLADLAALTTIV